MDYRTQQPQGSGAKWLGWGVAGIVGLGILASISSEPSPKPLTNLSAQSDGTGESANEAEQASPAELDAQAMNKGARQFKMVAKLNLPGSSLIFSQNCYDSLDKSFDWKQLDRCGGFDELAARWAEESDQPTSEELTYFGREQAATRYLAAATTHGLETSDADKRWERIGSAVAKLSLPRHASAESQVVEAVADSRDTSSDQSQNASNQLDDWLDNVIR
jgi:hypothetical protein